MLNWSQNEREEVVFHVGAKIPFTGDMIPRCTLITGRDPPHPHGWPRDELFTAGSAISGCGALWAPGCLSFHFTDAGFNRRGDLQYQHSAMAAPGRTPGSAISEERRMRVQPPAEALDGAAARNAQSPEHGTMEWKFCTGP